MQAFCVGNVSAGGVVLRGMMGVGATHDAMTKAGLASRYAEEQTAMEAEHAAAST